MKKIKILTITLAIMLITTIAFGGIYVQKQNRMENIVEDYKYAMDLKGTRNVRIQPKTEEGTETNVEDYKKAKEILEKRLESMRVDNYAVKLDEQSGNILVEIPENETTDAVVSQISAVGKFEIQDSETGEVLMNNKDIKVANVMYTQKKNEETGEIEGTIVCLNIDFTEEGAKKLEDISKIYAEVKETENESSENETTENAEVTEDANTEETSEDSKEKQIIIKIDNNDMLTTSFADPITTGSMPLSMGGSTKSEEKIKEYVSMASNIAILLNSGKLPANYTTVENEYVLSDITSQELDIVIYALLAIVVIALIRLLVKYKKQGAIATISYIGLISLFLILVRYANVVISIEGIFAIAITLVLNYIFVNKLLSKDNEETVGKKLLQTYKEFFIRIVPVCIVAIAFSFINWAPISSFGMVMFWGITLIAIYNSIVTNILLKIEADK